MGVAEYATLVTVEKESSVRNTVSFNTEKLDAALADTQYTKFKVGQKVLRFRGNMVLILVYF
jgi:hypothetical protein